ncbi:uncharacterized protein TNIN_352601 [Trichonephila inaurata madagascariensis]|uniref:Uncharacterized protein n=1 Tax=Trichonephila inaurata madagascariensis TaxID=2747483 RepID=A0A8X7BVH4_9ARAC|nr:uncharacterized protein TNIN_352601 [Trichonephila inaurata madagascariensis]
MNSLPIHFITRFLQEALSTVLAYNNLNWEPPVSIYEISPATPLLSRNIETALTHHCMVEHFSQYEPEWIHLPGTEAEIYIHPYLREYMNTEEPEDQYTYFYFISFICQLCVHAIRLERSEIVRFIIAVAVSILRSRCDVRHFLSFNQVAIEYNSYHKAKHGDSEDDGIGTDA